MQRLIPLLLVAASCSSIEGRYIESPAHGEDVGGLPIVVERTRWLRVTYKEVDYMLLSQVTVSTASADGGPGSQEIKNEKLDDWKVREIVVDPVNSQDVYAVDLMRPASGKIDYDLEFREDAAYPKRIKGVVEDQTIDSVREAAESFIDRLRSAAAPTSGELPEGVALVKKGEAILKIEYYDLHDLGADTTPAPVLVIQ